MVIESRQQGESRDQRENSESIAIVAILIGFAAAIKQEMAKLMKEHPGRAGGSELAKQLLRDLTAEQAADLLEFLASLR